MAVLPIRRLPDPVLRQKAQPVQRIDDALRRLIADMVDTMRAARGVGLAANQVGILLQVAVIEIPEEGFVRVLINPRVVEREGVRELEEGCLSVPGYRGRVNRSVRVVVKAQDENGKAVRIVAEDNLLAQALEHETDHLNGVLYLDRLVRKDAIWRIPEAEAEAPPPQPARPRA
ncbi:MAG: peptide deformylase [Dehalococcoidia bacterium]|nr:peptide deformylase [Dehalococcoidia bacterium]MDW8119191.1 peptide deformylase [Chloroflexota bacterium]